MSVSLCQANGACCGSHLQPEVCCQYLIWHHIRTFLYKASLTPGEGDNKPTVSQIFSHLKRCSRSTLYKVHRVSMMESSRDESSDEYLTLPNMESKYKKCHSSIHIFNRFSHQMSHWLLEGMFMFCECWREEIPGISYWFRDTQRTWHFV